MDYQFFKLSEFACSETGKNKINPHFVEALDKLRAAAGFPFVITSGYRSPEHPIEKAKVENGGKLGIHTEGLAADIAMNNGADRRRLVKLALEMGFSGIGVKKDCVHIDVRGTTPVMWGY